MQPPPQLTSARPRRKPAGFRESGDWESPRPRKPSAGSPSSHRVPRATPSRHGTPGSPGERARLLTRLNTQPAALCGAVTRNPPPPADATAEPRVPTSERWPGGECCPGLHRVHRTAGSALPAAAARPPPLPPLSRLDPEWEEPTGSGSGRVPALAPPRLFPSLRKLHSCEGQGLCFLGGALTPGRGLGSKVGPERPWRGSQNPGRGLRVLGVVCELGGVCVSWAGFSRPGRAYRTGASIIFSGAGSVRIGQDLRPWGGACASLHNSPLSKAGLGLRQAAGRSQGKFPSGGKGGDLLRLCEPVTVFFRIGRPKSTDDPAT